jgi:hypothetical protein
MVLTKKALVKSLVEKDTMYMHGKKIIVSGPEENRIIRAFNNVRFYKSDMSGKCDSLHSSTKSNLTQLIGKPILWNNQNQMTGDLMHLIGNSKTEKLDSLKVLNNAFIIQKDSLSKNGYNQIKGQNLFGRFVDQKLKEVDIIKNAESIYYIYNDKNEFVGIRKSVCSRINAEMTDNKIETMTGYNNAESNIYPEEEFPENARRLRGFIWRGDERITSLDAIFPDEELALDTKAQLESKKKATKAEKPMDVLNETLNYDEKNPKGKEKATSAVKPSKAPKK